MTGHISWYTISNKGMVVHIYGLKSKVANCRIRLAEASKARM